MRGGNGTESRIDGARSGKILGAEEGVGMRKAGGQEIGRSDGGRRIGEQCMRERGVN